jgi:hypothetical protein
VITNDLTLKMNVGRPRVIAFDGAGMFAARIGA